MTAARRLLLGAIAAELDGIFSAIAIAVVAPE